MNRRPRIRQKLRYSRLMYEQNVLLRRHTALERRWGVPSSGPLGGRFPTLDLVKA